MPLYLTAERGRLFRIVHVQNLPWLLANGIPCASSPMKAPDYVEIGNPQLIRDRALRTVPLEPGGSFADYLPFYLTPRSPMLNNIRTGWNGITKRPNSDIAILVSSVEAMRANGVTLLFTDRHAYMRDARWSADPADLARMIDWDILQRSDFARDDLDPGKFSRYQAEALAHRLVPVSALLGIACASDAARTAIEASVANAAVPLKVAVTRNWYF